MPEGLVRMDAVRIWLLGGFRVCVGEHVIPGERWRLRKARALVKLLALAPGHRLHREELIEQLWPDLSPEAADNQLRKALHEARRALDPSSDATFAHIASGPTLALAAGTWVDLEAFADAATEARRSREPETYERAADLYGGDLLPEDRYEDWSDVRRETVRADFLALLVEWARLLEARADLDRAGTVLRRAVALDPSQEDAGAGLMRLDALAGRRTEALRDYERLCSALREQLDAAPSASTLLLYERIRAGRAPDSDLDSDLWEEVGDLRLLSGDAPGAGAAFEHAVRTARSPSPPTRSARLHRKAAQAWLTAQRPEPALRHLHAARALTARVAGDELARRLAVDATWLWQTGRHEEAQEAAEAALRTAQTSGAVDALALAHETLAIVLHVRGAWREGVHAEIERLAVGDEQDSGLATVTEIHCCIGQYHLYGDGLSDSVEDYARRTLALALERRARRAEAFSWCLLGESLLLQGRWDESGACLQRSADLHAEFGPGSGGLSWQRLAELAVCRGDSTTAQSCLRRAMAIATVTPLAHHLWGRLFSIAALDAAERGDPYGVIRAARSAAAAGARYGDCPSCAVLLNPVVAEAYAALGDRAGAATYARAAAQVAGTFTSSAWTAMAESAAGSLAQVSGNPTAARTHHRAAADLYDRARQPFWAARSRLQAGLAGTGGRPDETGRRLIDEAASTFEQLGALRALDRARAAAAGVTTVPTPTFRLPVPARPADVEDLPVPAGPRRGFAEVR